MTRPFLLGLTGSIGMGKSTTAGFFREAGVPVWDADAAVHDLYAAGGPAVAVVGGLFPDAVSGGAVDRAALKRHIGADRAALSRIESAIHPLVAAHRRGFVDCAVQVGARLVLLDIPLLFETGAEAGLDATLVVTAPEDVQRARVLGRPGMTEEQLAGLLARQMPDAEKRARADHIIETTTIEGARRAVRDLLAILESRLA
jgi:dephospho-CoA kinase